MLKYTNIVIAFFLVLFLSSCVKDDSDDCEQRVHLQFSYNADGKTNVIKEYINSGKLFIYDKLTGDLFRTVDLSKSDLSSGTYNIKLPFGQYTLIVWGNMSNKTTIINSNKIDEARLASVEYLQSGRVSTNDALYFTRLNNVIIDKKQDAIYDLAFKSAHIKFDVHIKGLKELPKLTITNLSPQLDMAMNLTEVAHISYYPTLQNNIEHDTFNAKFNTFRIKDANLINVTVESAIRDPYIINLYKFISEQNPPIVITGKQEITIPILITFNSIGVTATIPEWIIDPSVPGVQ